MNNLPREFSSVLHITKTPQKLDGKNLTFEVQFILYKT